MWNCFGRVALREQGIAQQLVSWRRVRIHLQSMLQRSNGGTEIVLLHVRLAEADEAVRIRRFELGDLSILRDGNIELSLLVRRDPGLHVLDGLWRQYLRCEPQE